MNRARAFAGWRRRAACGLALALGLGMLAAAAACDGAASSPDASDAAGSGEVLACGPHARVNAAGSACECAVGYLGDACDRCASGYLYDGGRCVPRSQCPLGCGHGHCDAGRTPAVCACDAGYRGSACNLCADGYERGPDGGCAAAVPPPPSCAHGWLSYEDGQVVCRCAVGYAGDECDGCADGYAAVRGAGAPGETECVAGCAVGKYACDRHGTCVDTSEGPSCACEAGFKSDGALGCVPTIGAACEDPVALALGGAAAETSTIGGSATLFAGCSDGSAGAEGWSTRVFRVHLPTAQRVRVRATGAGGIVLSVRTRCGDATSELACAYVGLETPLEADLPAGDAFVFANGWASWGGAVTVRAEVVCPAGEAFAWDAQACVPDPCSADACPDPHRHVCQLGAAGEAVCGCDPGATASADGACATVADADGATCATALTRAPGKDQTLTLPIPDAVEPARSSCNAPTAGGTVYLALPLAATSRVRLEAHAGGPGPHRLGLSVRGACADATSERLCQSDDGSGFFLSSGPGITGGVLAAGVWTVIVDGLGADAPGELGWDVVADPCLALQACPGGQVATRAADWSSCACACPDGQVPGEGGCVASPCANANTCTSDRSRCVADGASYHCECPLGQVAAPEGEGCVGDPSAAAWTVLVYESLDNNLGLEVVGGAGASKALPDGAPVHVVWLSSTPGDNAGIYHEGMGAGFERVASWDRPDMGDWRTLRDFGTWAVEAYPAQHYALVVVDHGGGLQFGWDTGAGGTFIDIANGDYARALTPIIARMGTRFDLVDFEMCLMSRWEVAEATRPFARSFLASPEEAYGMSGRRIPALVGATPDASYETIGRAVVDTFAGAQAMNIESWVDVDATRAVTRELDLLADEMLTARAAAPELCAAYDAARAACYPFTMGVADLGCFASGLGANAQLPDAVRAHAQALAGAVATAVYTQPPRSTGIGIALDAFVLAADAPPAARALSADWSGEGAVWDDASHIDELLRECRGLPAAR